jgi:ankyrin repeat protein
MTPLHHAAYRNCAQVALCLLHANANPSIKDKVLVYRSAHITIHTTLNAGLQGGMTPLHLAADRNSTDVAQALLQAECDPNVKDEVSM